MPWSNLGLLPLRMKSGRAHQLTACLSEQPINIQTVEEDAVTLSVRLEDLQSTKRLHFSGGGCSTL